MSTSRTAHILILDPHRPRLDVIDHLLVSSGEAVRLRQLPIALGLPQRLEERDWDLILVHAPDFAPIAPIWDSLHRHCTIAPPLLAYGPPEDDDTVAKYLAEGARDYLDLERPRHFRHRILMSLAESRERHRLHICENRLHECGDLFLGLFEPHPQAMAYLHGGMHILANRCYRLLFGEEQPGALETLPLLDLVDPSCQERLRALMRRAGQGQTVDPTSITWRRKDGETFQATLHLRRAQINGESALQIVLQRAPRPRAQVIPLGHPAVKEAEVLRGADRFLERLRQALAEGRAGALLLMEPADLPGLREDVGIVACEQVLEQLGRLLVERLPPDTALARLGGGIYALLLSGHEAKTARDLASILHEAIEDAIFTAQDQSVTLTAHWGGACFPIPDQDPKALLEQAEVALAIARDHDEEPIHFYQDNAPLQPVTRDDWPPRLQEALEKGRLTLHYLPIVALHAQPGPRYEALLRYLEEDDRPVTPSHFMYAAERSGLAPRLDQWVMERVWETLARPHSPHHLFIKLSSATLRDEAFRKALEACLSEDRERAGRLVMEISEADAASYLKEVKSLTQTVRELGARVALEHFGAQPESLRLLRHLEVDYLKIDTTIIQALPRQPEACEQLQKILELSRERGLETIAEQVESAAVLDCLWQQRVHHIQGYYLREPGEALDYDFDSRI